MTLRTFPTVCGSIAATPSERGVAVHNAGYRALGLPFTYVAMTGDDLDLAIELMRSIGGRGLGVSMPFKSVIIPKLSRVSEHVATIGACNTVVFDADGAMTGYNTDWIGVRDSLAEAGYQPERVVVVGAGGVARAIAYALANSGAEVLIRARNEAAGLSVVQDLDLSGYAPLDGSLLPGYDLVANATSDSTASGPVELNEYPDAEAVFDVAFTTRETPLTTEAENRGMKAVPGWRMHLHQAMQQFRLYTEKEPPIDVIEAVLAERF